MNIEQIEDLHALDDLKRRYLRQTTAPLDGMWLNGFVPAATHYGWREGGQLCGYFCVNDDGYLLQFFVDPNHRAREVELFEHAVVRSESPAGAVKGVFVSTAEPYSLSLCLDHFRVFEVNALMYQLPESRVEPAESAEESTALTRIASSQLPRAVAFAMAEIGAAQDWVTSYYATLIDRGELYGWWSDDRLIATGESRRREAWQGPHADLGVVVARSHRGRGLATKILRALVSMNERGGAKSICSTERDNRAAQKAIARAGFVACNRVIRFDAASS